MKNILIIVLVVVIVGAFYFFGKPGDDTGRRLAKAQESASGAVQYVLDSLKAKDAIRLQAICDEQAKKECKRTMDYIATQERKLGVTLDEAVAMPAGKSDSVTWYYRAMISGQDEGLGWLEILVRKNEDGTFQVVRCLPD